MGFFDNSIDSVWGNEPKAKRKTLKDAIRERFTNVILVFELDKYLTGRKQQRNVPSLVSWEMQLDLLLNNYQTDEQRIAQVQEATLKGWRAVAFSTTPKQQFKAQFQMQPVQQQQRTMTAEQQQQFNDSLRGKQAF